MKFELLKQNMKIRRGRITTAHGIIETPVFMPVGTVGTVKAMKPDEVADLGAQIILGNTYHLYLRPGVEILNQFGGLHNFMGWDKPILTDSGGYQVFSLGKGKDNFQKGDDRSRIKSGMTTREDDGSQGRDNFQFSISNFQKGDDQNKSQIPMTNDQNNDFNGSLVKITEEGAIFKSHIDGSKHLFTPEKVIDIQLAIGSDIMMPLDFCPSAEATDQEIAKAVDQTNRWFERTWNYFQEKIAKSKEQKREMPGLFAIIQGGANEKLRKRSFEFLNQFPVDGFSIGGVANAGESKVKQQKALEYTLPLIAEDKPRYLMGVGEPDDMNYAISSGIDMFDCVLPTRLARHGVAWICQWEDKRGRNASRKDLFDGEFGKIDFRKSGSRDDMGVIMEGCDCYACKNGFSRAYIYHLFRAKEILGIRLLTEHNLRFVLRMFEQIRENV